MLSGGKITAELEAMRRDWDQRARENARFYVATARSDWSDREFFESGERTVAEHILTDMANICQGRDPRQMTVLEIGCGAGRVTRALSQVFGEVYAVDISAEMVRQARAALADRPRVQVFENNGKDLAVLGEIRFDFAFSSIVFQHIPSRKVIESYIAAVHRLLRDGALFKFQIQGDTTMDAFAHDSWLGVAYAEKEVREMAWRRGFQMRYQHGAGTPEYWLWFFKPRFTLAVWGKGWWFRGKQALRMTVRGFRRFRADILNRI